MFKNKAEVIVSFSWLFMAIVGVFFIALSYNIIMKYQDIEEEKFRLELQQSLRTILNTVGRTAGVEENSVEPLGNIFRDSTVELTCFQNIPIMSINGYPFAENSFIRNYPTGLTYISQGKITNTNLAIESFRMPFKTSNILSFVSEYNLIVFDKDSEISKEFAKKFRSESSYRDFSINFEYSFSDLSNFKNEISKLGLNSVIFVSDYGKDLLGLNLDDLNFPAYSVQIDYINMDSGGAYSKIKYINSNQNNFESKEYNSIDFDNSMSIETLAIFSNPQAFECAHNQLIENTKISFDFYLKKVEDIIELSQLERICSASTFALGDSPLSGQKIKYESLKDKIEEIKEELEQEGFSNPSDLLNELNILDSFYKDLERFNCYVPY